jgi:hypothetical protein
MEVEPRDSLDHVLPVTGDRVDQVAREEADLTLDLLDPVPTSLAEGPVELVDHNLPMRKRMSKMMSTSPTPPLGYGPQDAE